MSNELKHTCWWTINCKIHTHMQTSAHVPVKADRSAGSGCVHCEIPRSWVKAFVQAAESTRGWWFCRKSVLPNHKSFYTHSSDLLREKEREKRDKEKQTAGVLLLLLHVKSMFGKKEISTRYSQSFTIPLIHSVSQ